MKIGSLCSGYGGLDMAAAEVTGGTVAWHVEYDPAPSKILAHHWPDIPNHGNLTTTDWDTVEPVDVITAGYPCQPFSHAGHRKGAHDERHLWPHVIRAIRDLRPGLVLLENVAGHLTLGFDTVLADLAEAGFDAEWVVLRAADVGAPHGRARLFIAAPDASGERHGGGQDGRSVGRVDDEDAGQARQRERAREVAGDRGREAPADASHVGHERGRDTRGRRPGPANGGDAAADAAGDGRREGRPESARLVGGLDAAERGNPTAADTNLAAWGIYEPAIRRWERTLGRPGPRPTEPGRNGRERLSPAFVEWMMGLPAGHVTAVPGLARNAQLKALGNGVVPQQAAAAYRLLLPAAVAVA